MSTSEPPPGGPPEPSEMIGTLFADRFAFARLVSEGANTTVFDALDELNGRTVTVKLINPNLSSSPSFRRRFDETMRSVAALSHPNVAAVYDWGIGRVGDVSTAYVVVEQLTGGSLRDMFDRARQLSPSQALAVGLDACRGLDYAHRRGFVHSELTPSKLVFGDDRRLRLTDFGLARLLNEHTWQQPDSVANHVAWYASPEQGLSLPIDGKTDVYALCLTLHEAVTGTLPFRNDSTVASLSARVGKLMPVSADLGPLASILEHAGRPNADERSTAAEFGKELVQVASKLPRPEPLPLLSTGLFETPLDQLRSPDDPTGGVVRPPGDTGIIVVPLDRDPESTDPSDDADDEPVTPEPEPVTPEPVAPVGEAPDSPVIVDAEPDVELDTESAAADTGLVILPLDSDIGGRRTADAMSDEGDPVPGRSAAVTQAMPVVVPSQPRRRGFPWKILLSLLVLAALAVLGVLATQLFATPVYIVPDLVELPEAEARNLVATNGWVISREVERSDVIPVVGQIVRTAPGAGVELAEGEPFLLVVSGGPTLRELPESTGVLLSEAQTRLVERGLVVETVEAFDEVVLAGTVIEWSVPGDSTLRAGSLVEPETPVRLVVSLGPAPRTIPNVIGQTAAAARDQVEGLALTLTETEQAFSDDVSLGSIISQGIEPGTEVPRGSDLTIVVSKGPDLVTFPDITVAPNYEAAAQLLFEAGFEPRLTFGDSLGEIRSYTIDGGVPDIGATFRRGTQVDIEAL